MTSRRDGDRHYIDNRDLMRLYDVKPWECCSVEDPGHNPGNYGEASRLVWLRPREDGDYTLPTFVGPNPPPPQDTDAVAGLHRALDEDPKNSLVRLLLADALEESGVDALYRLGAGYRALGGAGLYPYHEVTQAWWWGNGGHSRWTKDEREKFGVSNWLPGGWFAVLKPGEMTWTGYGSRRLADDAAADAYARWQEIESMNTTLKGEKAQARTDVIVGAVMAAQGRRALDAINYGSGR